ncbi:MAG: glycogen-binding domain-containing protein [Thermodesulfobacteriota bacterium]|nr:glycogen-binding domain-containing protein [Thermodesulfobacteriota bacterium]
MNNYLISMFIDDELDLDDKLEFVERVHEDRSLKDEAIEFLHQEKLLRTGMLDTVPDVDMPIEKKFFLSSWRYLLRPAGIIGSALAAALIVVFLLISFPRHTDIAVSHRFVIYRPDVNLVELVGSFNEWRRIPMEEIGNSGYWEVKLALPPGEHRFSYILEGNEKIADPTVSTRERDDFGGENSVLLVNA